MMCPKSHRVQTLECSSAAELGAYCAKGSVWLEKRENKVHIHKMTKYRLDIIEQSLDLYINFTLPKSWLVHYSSFIIAPNSSKFGVQTLLEVSHSLLLFIIKKVNISLKILWF
jgi:hypothetical protein